MVRLQLLCHGSTAATKAAAFPRDEPLTGFDSPALEGVRTRIRPARRWFSSPELRARQTAEALQLNPEIATSLRECDYGRWAGRTFQDVQTEDATGLADWLQDPDAAPHGGEPLAALLARVAAFIEEMSVGPKHRILVVTHASIIRAAIILGLGAPPLSFWRIDIAPLSSVTLKGHRGRWTLESLVPNGSA